MYVGGVKGRLGEEGKGINEGSSRGKWNTKDLKGKERDQ